MFYRKRTTRKTQKEYQGTSVQSTSKNKFSEMLFEKMYSKGTVCTDSKCGSSIFIDTQQTWYLLY